MDDIIAMAREAGFQSAEFWPDDFKGLMGCVERFAALVRADERNKLAAWMMAQGYATGHGDTMEGLLEELEREIGFDRAELWIKRINEAVLAEREACLNCYSPDDTAQDWADKIRARSKHHEQV
ncbi:MAG: hypothetical protein AN484_11970 [Aphanizomenon flos-aquae WA102]|uniref:Uncharacterized protein n=1 Tax=Aphanizomenon flos-aquae WA102 TaxID=1710896 RepID=A0A1B7X2K7_APHFL|nr:MAG: hypothetical protein AN484_11970 [Aphanizomenon flos-aquae WA102]